MDAPELGQAFGLRSRDSLAGMRAGAMATIEERAASGTGRALGRMMSGSFDANAEQLHRGMAWRKGARTF